MNTGSYNSGTVNGSGSAVGGVAGNNGATINYCYWARQGILTARGTGTAVSGGSAFTTSGFYPSGSPGWAETNAGNTNGSVTGPYWQNGTTPPSLRCRSCGGSSPRGNFNREVKEVEEEEERIG